MNQDKKETISSFDEMSEDSIIYLKEMEFDGEMPEEKDLRKALLTETRRGKTEQEYKAEMKNRNKNGILPPEAIIERIIETTFNYPKIRNKTRHKK